MREQFPYELPYFTALSGRPIISNGTKKPLPLFACIVGLAQLPELVLSGKHHPVTRTCADVLLICALDM
jgi:hypothetical protein